MSYGFFITTSYLVTFGILACLIGVSGRAYREEKNRHFAYEAQRADKMAVQNANKND
ncbi:MAG: heme exporter protein CcmD [Parvibaculales bacterium]